LVPPYWPGRRGKCERLPCREPDIPVLPLILNCNPRVWGAFIESAGRPLFFNAADGLGRALREAFTDTKQEDVRR